MLVLVPMLFVLPPGWAPLVVAAGLLAGGGWEWSRGRLHPERALVLLPGAWHAVGPALVLPLAGAPAASFGDWPLYAAALAAQFGFDFASAATRERIVFEVPVSAMAPALARVWLIDLMLAPLGFLAALAAADEAYAWLLVLPGAALLADMARDRRSRITEVLQLAHAYRAVDQTAHRDPLTGVGNRLAWDEAVALADAQGAEPVSVIIADLDGLEEGKRRVRTRRGRRAHLRRGRDDPRRGARVRTSSPGSAETSSASCSRARRRSAAGSRPAGSERAVAEHPPVAGIRLTVSLGWAATPDVPTVTEARRVADQQMYAEKHDAPHRPARLAQGRRALEQQRVDERLRQVAAQLALARRRTPRRAAPAGRRRRGCARTSARRRRVALLVRRRAPSRTRTAGTRPRPRPAAARRAGSGRRSRRRSARRSTASQRRERARVVGAGPRRGSPASSSAASTPLVAGGALPAPARVDARGRASATIASASATPVGRRSRRRTAAARSRAARRRRSAGCGSSASGSSSQMPASGSLPALAIASAADVGRAPAVGVEAVVPRRGGEQQQRLAEGVELELLVGPVADDVAAAGVAGQLELPLVGHAAPPSTV